MCRLPEYEYSVPVTKLWPVQLSTSASHYLYLKHTKGLSVSPVLPHHHRNTGGSITTTLSGEDYWWSSWSWHPPLMTHFKLPHPPHTLGPVSLCPLLQCHTMPLPGIPLAQRAFHLQHLPHWILVDTFYLLVASWTLTLQHLQAYYASAVLYQSVVIVFFCLALWQILCSCVMS